MCKEYLNVALHAGGRRNQAVKGLLRADATPPPETVVDVHARLELEVPRRWFRPSVRTPLPNYLSPVIWADWTLTNCRVAGQHSVNSRLYTMQ